MGKDPFSAREADRYAHPIASREAIIKFMHNCSIPVDIKDIATNFKINTKSQHKALLRRLSAMVRDGQILKNRYDYYVLVEKLSVVKAKVIKFKEGLVLIKLASGQEAVVTKKHAAGLMLDDVILVRVGLLKYAGYLKAVLIDIIARGHKQVVGYYVADPGLGYIRLVRNLMFADVVLVAKINVAGLKSGDCVVANILGYPKDREPPTCIIKEIIESKSPESKFVDIAVRAYDLAHSWPQDVLNELKHYNDYKVMIDKDDGRLDLRHLGFVTIDGATAKDFDDAIYVEPAENSSWYLWVAIADVSHYVQPGSALDVEALSRANSVYFPQQVLPMLPPELADNLCSLQPDVDRLVVVVKLHISHKGKILTTEFERAVIKSKARLTYKQVMDVQQLSSSVAGMLQHAFALHSCLEHTKLARGALEFDFQESVVIYDDDHAIKAIQAASRLESHKLIENFMLVANNAVAKFLAKRKVTALYRVHLQPELDKLASLIKIDKADDNRSILGKLQQAMQIAKAKCQNLEQLQLLILRSMRQANYSTENAGHFGLSYTNYTHFTSPIRRYADLIVHRVLLAEVNQGASIKYNAAELLSIAEHCSVMERKAELASREVVGKLKCEFMHDKLGQSFAGKIVAVVGFGFFVRLQEHYVEGLVHVAELPKDYYKFDEVKGTLVGKNSGVIYKFGITVKVRLLKVDFDLGRLDFGLI